MSESALMYVFMAAIFAVAAYALYVRPRLIERKVREPLSAFLDKLIAQVADVDKTPLSDLGIHYMERGDGSSEFVYWVYPLVRYPFMFYRVSDGEEVRYVIGYEGSRSWDFTTPFSCRSAWFTDRMERLISLLVHYPRKRTINNLALNS